MLKSEREYLNKKLKQYLDLVAKLSKKAVIADLNLYTKIKKESKTIEKIALTFQKFLQKEQELQEWKDLVNREITLKIEGKKEITLLEKELINLYQKIQSISKDENKQKGNNTIIEIRGAVGGKEANLFAGDLFNMYTNFCELKKWKYEVWEANATEEGGYSLIILHIKNKDVYPLLKHEAGVHRVQRIPKTESSGRIHTSTATVAVLEEKTVEDFPIDNQEIRIDTFRSSGAGGQHVNTTDSAVRVTHLPTGLVVSCQEGRSQHDNKDKALKVLRSRLFQKKQSENTKKNVYSRNQQIGEGERSEKIRTYNFLQNRITDHRINWSYKNIDHVLGGKLDILLAKLRILDTNANDNS